MNVHKDEKLTHLADYFYQNNDLENTIYFLQLSIVIFKNSSSMNKLAILYENNNDIFNARKYYLMAIKYNNIDAMINYGQLCEYRKSYSQALKYYTMAVKNNSIDAINCLGRLYYRLNKYKIALKYLLKAFDNDNYTNINYIVDIYNKINYPTIALAFNTFQYLSSRYFKNIGKYYIISKAYYDVNKLHMAKHYLYMDLAHRFNLISAYLLIKILEKENKLNVYSLLYLLNNNLMQKIIDNYGNGKHYIQFKNLNEYNNRLHNKILNKILFYTNDDCYLSKLSTIYLIKHSSIDKIPYSKKLSVALYCFNFYDNARLAYVYLRDAKALYSSEKYSFLKYSTHLIKECFIFRRHNIGNNQNNTYFNDNKYTSNIMYGYLYPTLKINFTLNSYIIYYDPHIYNNVN